MTEIGQLYIRITGRVQGVWFRASTQRKAQELGLKGWVRNLSDGRVELLAKGDPELVQELRTWIEDGGPPTARVERIEEIPGPEQYPAAGFEIKP